FDSLMLILILVGVGGIVYLLVQKKDGNPQDQLLQDLEKLLDKNDRVLKDEMSRNRKEASELQMQLREELTNLFKGFGDSLDKRVVEIRNTIEKRLELIQKDNGEKLEAMRSTVDEKLHATLEKRFGESFKVVSDRLEAVHKGLGEMQTLAVGVGDLKK